MNLFVYTDGSATVATKPGGYAYVLVEDGQKISEGFGPIENSTNNDAELRAAIEGLKAAYKELSNRNALDKTYSVTLVCDSQIVLGWANGSYKFKQIAKIQEYEKLKRLVSIMSVKTQWVQGHSGDEFNDRCDKLANIARKSLESPKLNPKKERAIKNKQLKNSVKPRSFAIDEGVLMVRYRGVLKKIDLTNNTIQDYNDDLEVKI